MKSFAPASVIFSAVSTLWEVGETYRKYFRAKAVGEILAEIHPHLERFQVHLEYAKKGARPHAPVVRCLSYILTDFLHICAFYSKVKRNEANPLRRTLNVIGAIVGDGNSQVKDHLNDIEKQAKAEERYSIASIYGNSRYVEGDRMQDKYEELIRLRFEEDLNPSVLASWGETEKTLKTRFIKEVGSWLERNDLFSSWADTNAAKADPTLVLQGEEGSGKTHLAYRAIRRLKRDIGDRMQEKSVACFYFKTTEREEAIYTVRQALIAIIWQFAKTDPEYREFVASRCKDTGERLPNTELLNRFVTGYTATKKKTFFIVLDGIDQADQTDDENIFAHVVNQSRKLVDGNGNFQIRVLLTITNALSLTDEQMFASEFSKPCPSIVRTAKDQQHDIRHFVDKCLARNYKGLEERPGSDNLPSQIKDRLVRSYRGNFKELDVFLDEIANAIKTGRLKEMQDREFQDLSETLAFQIKRYNHELEPTDIETLNKIIMCIVLLREQFPTPWPTLQQLQAFLEWNHVRRLEDEIRGKFSSLLKIIRDNGVTRVQSEVLKDYFKKTIKNKHSNKSHPQPLDHEIRGNVSSLSNIRVWPDVLTSYFKKAVEPNPTETSSSEFLTEFSRIAIRECQESTVPIPDGGLDVLRNLFFATYGSSVWPSLQMEDHFKRLQARKEELKNELGFNVVSGHVRIIRCILHQVCGGQTSWFNEYAAAGLPYHLNEVKPEQIRCADAADRSEIGYYLCQFFLDEKVVMRWTAVESEPARNQMLVFDQGWYGFIRCALGQWFQDTAVWEGALKYLSQTVPGSDFEIEEYSSTMTKHLLEASERTIATQWVNCYQRDAFEAFEIYAYAYYFVSWKKPKFFPVLTQWF